MYLDIRYPEFMMSDKHSHETGVSYHFSCSSDVGQLRGSPVPPKTLIC